MNANRRIAGPDSQGPSPGLPLGAYIRGQYGRHPKLEHDIIDAKLRRMQDAGEYGEEYDELVHRLDDLWAEYQEQREAGYEAPMWKEPGDDLRR